MSTTARSRRQDLLRTIPLGTIIPAAFIAFGFLQQGHLGDALHQDWWAVVLAFVVGALTVVLPGKFPLIAALAAILVFLWVSTITQFDAIAMICCVLAGFFFGLFVRSLMFQRKNRKNART
ncbi:hypothetical protein [Humibacter sp.]|uniref:hypothetical protein n=1 Tax=Humibacter sp. TaxID=1940291 RepID=UPI003F811AE6